jgi:hypothetical protein
MRNFLSILFLIIALFWVVQAGESYNIPCLSGVCLIIAVMSVFLSYTIKFHLK